MKLFVSLQNKLHMLVLEVTARLPVWLAGSTLSKGRNIDVQVLSHHPPAEGTTVLRESDQKRAGDH